MKAGLFDRAEAGLPRARRHAFDSEARLALLSLYERSRDWRAAAEVAAKLEASGDGLVRLAHRALLVRAGAAKPSDAGDDAAAATRCGRARDAAPHAPRPLLSLAAPAPAQKGDAAARDVAPGTPSCCSTQPAPFPLVASDYATRGASPAARPRPRAPTARAALQQQPSVDLLHALRLLDGAQPAPTTAVCRELRRRCCKRSPRCRRRWPLLDTPIDAERRAGRARRCARRWREPPSRCSATAAPPAASRRQQLLLAVPGLPRLGQLSRRSASKSLSATPPGVTAQARSCCSSNASTSLRDGTWPLPPTLATPPGPVMPARPGSWSQ